MRANVGIGFPIAARSQLNSSVHRRSQQIPITVLGHPTRTGEMTLVDASGALTILVRIKPEQDADDLCPLRSFLRCLDYPNIDREAFPTLILHLPPFPTPAPPRSP